MPGEPNPRLAGFFNTAPAGLLSLFLGLAAAALAWQLNKTAVFWVPRGRVVLAPLAEESAKTLPAVILGADIFLTHLFFGVVEGIWEFISVSRGGIYAALAAVGGHSIFGALTFLVFMQAGTAPALVAGYLAHAAWNGAVLKFFAPR
ncbi:MAG: putative membrane protein [Pelotomaculum thermopropionicum]|uniref:Putative membrane protein n=1 Tax=Pelotomaculum thermopropionicum TaxID=110500 RepID=A0A101HS42_9FIRM|nr:MAG: putative membrane protein [Pelotomaculum thermopropionicum]